MESEVCKTRGRVSRVCEQERDNGIHTALLSGDQPRTIGMATAVESPRGLATSSQDPVSILRLVRTAAALTPKEVRPKREMAVAVEKSIVYDIRQSGYGGMCREVDVLRMWRRIQSGQETSLLILSRFESAVGRSD